MHTFITALRVCLLTLAFSFLSVVALLLALAASFTAPLWANFWFPILAALATGTVAMWSAEMVARILKGELRRAREGLELESGQG